MGERQFGPYRLVHQIAVGGMAEIYLAKTRGIAGFEKYVALKMIHPNFSQDEQFVQMLIDEAKITVQLQHVNIAQTFDLGRVGHTYYITMEFVDGADLYKLLRRGAEKQLAFPVDVAAWIAKEVSTGLDYAHRKRDVTGAPLRIVHRDVSPQNVLISHAGEVKIVDFGIAKATMRARQTAVGVIKGKYYYMSPEQAWGDPVDHRSDIFSAGIVLYELLTGQMLYLEEDIQKLLDMVRKANIPPPTTLRRDIPPQLERIVMRALQKNPSDRYKTAADFGTDLERFLHVYSPVFTSVKVAAYFHHVLDEEAAPEPTPIPVERVRLPEVTTERFSADQLVQERSEFTDENSVIFAIDELKPDPPQAGGQPRARDVQTMAVNDPAGEGEEHTLVSGPPGFDSETELGGRSALHEAEEDAPTQTRLEAVPEATEVDPTAPGYARARRGPRSRSPARHPQQRLRARATGAAHPALLARTPQPAVSELGQRRPSRRTPASGTPMIGGSVLSAIVSSGVTEPSVTRPVRGRGPASDGIPAVVEEGKAAASHRVSDPPAPPRVIEAVHEPALPLAAPSRTPLPFPGLPTGGPKSLKGDLAALEIDVIPDAYKIRRAKSRWLLRGSLAAVCVAAGVLLGIFVLGDSGVVTRSSILIESIPSGASVFVNGEMLAEKTPTQVRDAAPGRYALLVSMPGHRDWTKEVLVPEGGGEPSVVAFLKQTGVDLVVRSRPSGAQVFIAGKVRGRTPLVLDNINPASAPSLEVRLKGHSSERRELDWRGRSEIELEVRLDRVP